MNTVNEQKAAAAFSKQSSVFDEIYVSNKIIQYKRARVRDHVNRYLAAHSNILELNAGTGEDTLYFAQQGHRVHATDIAEGMLNKLSEKVKEHKLVTIEQCSFTALDTLSDKGPYDFVFSNFAGLNCTDQLGKVLQSLLPLLNPGGTVTIVILPPFCLWETLLALRGDFKTAFRRFNSRNGVPAWVEGIPFTCWYYKSSAVIAAVKNDFEILDVEGLCTIVPPSYLERFPVKYPKVYQLLMGLENRLKGYWPWKSIGDYYIISLKKK